MIIQIERTWYANGGSVRDDPLRFETRDINLYGYVFNDPVNLTDPSGLQT